MATELALTITGDRSAGRHCIILGDQTYWVTGNQFSLLCTLALARKTSRLGYVQADPFDSQVNAIAVCRLRRATHDLLIETGTCKEYRLRCSDVVIDESIAELPRGILPPAIHERLVELATTKLKPAGN